jgi:hypothetical protein
MSVSDFLTNQGDIARRPQRYFSLVLRFLSHIIRFRSKALGKSKSEAYREGIDDEIVQSDVAGRKRDLARFESQRERDSRRQVGATIALRTAQSK